MLRYSLLLFSAAFLLQSCEKDTAQTNDKKVNPYLIHLADDQMHFIKTDTVKEIPDIFILTMNGKVSYDQNHVAQVFPMAGGLVSRITASVGDRVHKGQVLAEITGGDISSVAGQYEIAKANTDLAKKALDAAEQLYHTNVYSERDYLNAKSDYTKALAEEAKAKSYAGMMGLSDKTQIYNVTSPVDGFIVEKNVSENMIIRSDNAMNMFTVSSLDQVWVMADLYETDLSKVKVGDKVKITTIAYPDKIFNGTISQIGNALDPVSRVAKVKIVLDNSEGLLKPEMYANVKCYNVDNVKKVLAVPTKSLILEGNHYIVMVRRGSNEFSKEPISINRTIENITIVNSGVKSGDTVVTEGSLLVSNNNAAIINQ